MCGIFGFVATDVVEFDTAAAIRALAHRGPDGEGVFRGTAGDARCELAHTRLAIIDLSERGRQPMASHDGRYQIVFNGEVFNYVAVRRELEARGSVFRSGSDTEVILAAFIEWGPACVDRFRGMFAFAIWDTITGHLLLARDRLGIKPLYVVRADDFIVFASEVRALLAAKVVPPRLSLKGLRSYLEWGAVMEPDTILTGVECLPPGSTLEWVPFGPSRSRQYWELRPHPAVEISFEDALERVRPVLQEAAALRLVSDVPVGVFLSGGIDSSLLTALAARACKDRLHTFNVSFREESMSEAIYAEQVAREFGCEHHALLLDPELVRGDFERALRALDQPSSDGVNTYFVARAVRSEGIKVALSGLGGDELFAGYGSFRSFETATRVAGRVPSAFAAPLHATSSAASLGEVPSRMPKLAALLTGERGAIAAYRALRCMFTPMQANALMAPGLEGIPGAPAAWPQLADDALERGLVDPVSALSALELGNYMRNVLLRDADVMSMAHGLEVRVPLIDHVLIETVLPLWGRVKLSDQANKPLLLASGPPLPKRVTHRSKMGFALPFESWFRGPLRPLIEDLLSPRAVDQIGALRSRAVTQMWMDFLAGDGRITATRVWSLAAVSGWCRVNGVGL